MDNVIFIEPVDGYASLSFNMVNEGCEHVNFAENLDVARAMKKITYPDAGKWGILEIYADAVVMS